MNFPIVGAAVFACTPGSFFQGATGVGAL